MVRKAWLRRCCSHYVREEKEPLTYTHLGVEPFKQREQAWCTQPQRASLRGRNVGREEESGLEEVRDKIR